MTNRLCRFSPTAQAIFLFGLTAASAFAQSGDISGATGNFTTLGQTILKVGVGLAGMAFVGLMIWGGLTLTTNRPSADWQWWAAVWWARCSRVWLSCSSIRSRATTYRIARC